jgi:hypothetical protein
VDRVFVDANLLFSAAYDPACRLRALWHLVDVHLITSSYASTEAHRNIDAKRPARTHDLQMLLERCEVTTHQAAIPDGIRLPSKDVPILGGAIAARATHLLTGDHDFAPYFGRVISGVLILLPGDYLHIRGI